MIIDRLARIVFRGVLGRRVRNPEQQSMPQLSQPPYLRLVPPGPFRAVPVETQEALHMIPVHGACDQLSLQTLCLCTCDNQEIELPVWLARRLSTLRIWPHTLPPESARHLCRPEWGACVIMIRRGALAIAKPLDVWVKAINLNAAGR